jgi:hypothetical protein
LLPQTRPQQDTIIRVTLERFFAADAFNFIPQFQWPFILAESKLAQDWSPGTYQRPEVP